MDYIDRLENRSIYMMREAYALFRDIGLLWSIGKDSTVMVWIARKAFLGELPFPVIHIDSSCNFQEMYDFKEQYKKEWNLNVIDAKNEVAIEKGIDPKKNSMEECCENLKTSALKNCRKKNQFKALLFGIRGDDHGMPGNKQVLLGHTRTSATCSMPGPPMLWDMHNAMIASDDHIRIHPMQHWTLPDIWKYIKRERIPIVDLYFAKDGKRYKGIGCQPCAAQVDSTANSVEKIIKEVEEAYITGLAGKSDNTEDAYTIQKLKSLGYM